MPSRAQFYAMIHMGASRLGYADDSDYRNWLESLTGKRSLKECSFTELSSLTTTLRACNALENPRIKAVKGGRGQGERPTESQWLMANGLCQELGMSGCDDARFSAFAKRVTKVDHPRFLTLRSMQVLIAALKNWIDNVKERGGKK